MSPSCAGPYRDVQLSTEFIPAFTPWFEDLHKVYK